MDILSHGLWAGAGYKALKKKENYRGAFFWGIFPDLFAFGPSFIILITQRFAEGRLLAPNFHGDMETGSFTLMQLADLLYKPSHSLVVFILVTGAITVYRYSSKKPGGFPWLMSGWALHIFLDIPTHATGFFPTPFLWPLVSTEINGIPWSTPWFLAINYIALLIIYLFLIYRDKKSAVYREKGE